MYSHICGPREGGLNAYANNIPYFPIRDREKVLIGERIPEFEALKLLVSRSNKSSRFTGCTEPTNLR